MRRTHSRFLALVLLATLTIASSLALAGEKTCTEVRPGKSLGPLSIGMDSAALDASGFAVGELGGPFLSVGPYRVRFENNAIVSISSDDVDTPCVRIGSTEFVLLESSLETLAVGSKGMCSPLQLNLGATVVACNSGVTFMRHMGGKTVQVEAASSMEGPLCDAWVQPGTPEGPASTNARAKVGEKSNVCVGNRVFTAELVADDVTTLTGKMHISTCERQANRGATVVSCNFEGIRLIFAGPKGLLHRVESIALRE